MGREFWARYEEALGWARALPLEDKIRLPFLPFFIGVAAWKHQQLSVIPRTLVLRGQLFESKGLFTRVVTEYANTGIVLQTGVAVLNNDDLRRDPGLEKLRAEFRNITAGRLCTSLVRRDGVSLRQLAALYKLTRTNFFSSGLAFRKAGQNVIDIIQNVLGFKNIRRRVIGWGHELTADQFWRLWQGSEEQRTAEERSLNAGPQK
jgi:hypothetical protein